MAPSQLAKVTTLNAADVSGRLREILGARLTAIIAGAPDTRTVHRWADGTERPGKPIEARLRAALDVTETLLEVDSPELIRLWFMGQNPLLDDDAPALHLATEPDEVLLAARVYAFHG